MVKQPQSKLPSWVKLLLDFGPLGAFFLGYRLGDIATATVALIAATAVSLTVLYAAERRLALAPLITGVIVLVFGALTLALDDERFIKLKPTIINLLFAATLLTGAYAFRKGLLRYVLDIAFELSEQGWLVLSRRWGFFFLFLAALNEFIWRSFPTEFWVNFKVFGMFTLTMVFAMAQVPLLNRYNVPKA